MEWLQWQSHCAAYARRNYPGYVGFQWLAWDVVHKDLGVFMFMFWFLCGHLFIFSSAHDLMCSHSPSAFSSSDCSILPCWCLVDEPLDCFGDQAISRAAMYSCVNLSQGATSYIPTPSQCSQGQGQPPPSGCSRCFNNTAEFRGSPSAG